MTLLLRAGSGKGGTRLSTVATAIGQTITIANLTASDAVDCAVHLVSALPKGKRTVVVEMPCIGAPGLAHRTLLSNVMGLPEVQTSEQFFLDYDRKETKPLDQYIFRHGQIDYMLIHPRAVVDNTVIGSLRSNRALIEGPGFLKEHLQQRYDYIIFVTQGIMNQPSTFFSIRYADAVILYSNHQSDFIGNDISRERLVKYYGVPNERLFHFSADRHVTSKTTKVFSSYADVFKAIDKVPAQLLEPHFLTEGSTPHGEIVGRINPAEYLSFEYNPSVVMVDSDEDQEQLEQFMDHIRTQLKQNHLDDFSIISQSSEARQRVRFYIADMVRENIKFKINMNTEQLIDYMQQNITMFGPLQPLLDDPRISSIEVNDLNETIVEQDGVDVYRSDIVFRDYQELYQIINRMLAPFGKTLTSDEPIIDAYFEGMRICAIADTELRSGVSNDSPMISIRKFPKHIYDRVTCIENGNISKEMDDFFAAVIPHGVSVVVAGSTNSGKTSKVQMLPMYMDPVKRIITIEDSKELVLKHKDQYKAYKNLPSLTVKEIGDKDKSIDMGKLVKTSLRLRPNGILIGEIRDKEAASRALEAANTGHFVWTTIHATSARSTPSRFLEVLKEGESVAPSISEGFDLIIFQRRMSDGRRIVTDVMELIHYGGYKELEINTIFTYDMLTKKHEHWNRIRSAKVVEKLLAFEMPLEALEKWCDLTEYKQKMQRGRKDS